MDRLRSLFLVFILCTFPAFLLAQPVDINTADAATLEENLKGIGTKRAEAIVNYRKEHGPFKTVDDLVLVKGVGPSVVEKNRANLQVGKK